MQVEFQRKLARCDSSRKDALIHERYQTDYRGTDD